MPTLDVFSLANKKTGSMDLSDDVFGATVNVALVHQVLKAQLAGRRRGTAKTKTKSEVRGGGAKPFNQKGTGNARQGSSRSPLQPGGGQSFGPVPRSYEQATPKEMIRGALRSALSDRVKAGRLFVIDSMELSSPKTKALAATLGKAWDLKSMLVVDSKNQNLDLASRNIPNLKVLRSEGLNVYDIVKYDGVLMSKASVTEIQSRLSGEARATKVAEKTAAKKSATAKKTAAKKKA